MGAPSSNSGKSKLAKAARILGISVTVFLMIDFVFFLLESSTREAEREAARVTACYEDPSAKGCEKEAYAIKAYQDKLKAEEDSKMQAERERRKYIERMTPTCATIATQHYHMRMNSRFILSNKRWHDAGCRQLFGSIRDNNVRNHSSLPPNWRDIDFTDAFPEKCWYVGSEDLVPCKNR